MQTQNPCSDHVETKGLIYFARMLDKIRLKARGELPPDYFTGVDEDPTMFDARCTRFIDVNYDDLVERTLKGGSDEEILEWCFERGRRPSEEEIAIWNSFLSKRGWTCTTLRREGSRRIKVKRPKPDAQNLIK